jgi:hypothetical protein
MLKSLLTFSDVWPMGCCMSAADCTVSSSRGSSGLVEPSLVIGFGTDSDTDVDTARSDLVGDVLHRFQS